MRMNKSHFWKGTLVVAGGIICALALSFGNSGIASGAFVQSAYGGQGTGSSQIHGIAYEGMITDTRCGAKHSAAIGMTAADCTRVCVHGGERFALVDGDALLYTRGRTGSVEATSGAACPRCWNAERKQNLGGVCDPRVLNACNLWIFELN